MKKQWESPQLISLYRGKPEEMVLCGCKYTTSGTNAGISNNYHCDKHCNACITGTKS